MTTFTVSLGLPPRELCGNGAAPASRGANIALNRLRKAQRASAGLCAYQALAAYPEALRGPLFPSGRVLVTALVKRDPQWSTRALDDDNLWRGLKSALDSLQDAGVIVNDSQLQLGAVTWERAPFGQGEVVLTLKSEEGA